MIIMIINNAKIQNSFVEWCWAPSSGSLSLVHSSTDSWGSFIAALYFYTHSQYLSLLKKTCSLKASLRPTQIFPDPPIIIFLFPIQVLCFEFVLVIWLCFAFCPDSAPLCCVTWVCYSFLQSSASSHLFCFCDLCFLVLILCTSVNHVEIYVLASHSITIPVLLWVCLCFRP